MKLALLSMNPQNYSSRRLREAAAARGHTIRSYRTDHFSIAVEPGHPDLYYYGRRMPQVDAVITHAGNNTTTECMHFGKPMLALPIFWDQHDNAQRVDETGFGVRLPTYSFEQGALAGAIERLLGDERLRGRLAEVSKRLQESPGNELAAELVERVTGGQT